MVFLRSEGDNPHKGSRWGTLILALGGSGGPKIISAVLQVLLNFCFLGMPLYDSVTRPRIHDQLVYHDAVVTNTEKYTLAQGPTIEVSQRTKDALLRRGHGQLIEMDYAGTVQAVAVDLETNSLSAVSDIRKGGSPDGY
jgi:gamma-glutamyltranspeptidase